MADSTKNIHNSEFEQKLKEAAGEPVPKTHTSALKSDVSSDYDPDVIPVNKEQVRADNVIPVIEEQVHVDKEVVETGSVYIYKDVHEEEVSVDLPYSHEEVEIERVPINEYAAETPPPIRYEGEKMIIPVLKEVLVVEKRTMVVEELHIIKRRIENKETQKVNLRREEIKVDREDYNQDRTESENQAPY